MTSTTGGRILLFIERAGYGLLFIPFLTDYIEQGSWPRRPRELVTEIVVAALLLSYIWAIRWARKRLGRLEEDRRTLTALLIHDMKTPLTNVMGTLSHLEDHPDDLDHRRLIRSALRSCREDVELMTQLMEADRLEEGWAVHKRPVDMPELLRSCAEEASATAYVRKIAFSVSHGEEVGLVSADEGVLRRVLMNLIRNALKFTKPGGRVEVRAEAKGSHLVVSVLDTGVGVPSDGMDKLFGKFSRVSTTEGTPLEGWGLGLYFCKLAVEAHGGRIVAQSRPGEETVVRFAVPLNGEAGSPEEASSVFKDLREFFKV